MAKPAFLSPRAAACLLAGALAGWLLLFATRVQAETLSLADCLRETVAHNPQIIEQRYAVEQATATRLTFRARALPTFTIGGLGGYLGERNTETVRIPVRNPATGKTTDVIVNNERAATELLVGSENFSQPLFDAAIPASWRRGDLGVTAAQESLYTVVAAQLNATRTLFYQALFQQENADVLRRIDDLSAGEVKTLDQLVTAGLVGRQAALAAQVQRTNFGSIILTNTGNSRVFLTSLLQSMGRELGPVRVSGSSSIDRVRLTGLLEDRAIAFDPARAAREALAHRPDIRSLRAIVREIDETANIVRAGYYPAVTLYVDGELIPQSFVERTNTSSTRTSDQTQVTEIRPGVMGSWAIIDTGTVGGTVRTLQAQSGEISVALQQAERNVPSDLAFVRAQMTDASERIAALRGNVDTAENTLNMIQAGLAQGINSQLEFLDAQNGVLGTRAGLLAAELEMSEAHASFDRLTGRYLQFSPEEPAAPHHSPARK